MNDNQNEVLFDLDKGIKRYVSILRENGIETFESCEGGKGHAAPYPMIRFHGDDGAGFKALAVAISNNLPVWLLNRFYQILDKTPHGPYWELVFSTKDKNEQ